VLSSFFQNSDGTTAATATNDPIGYWADLTALGGNARQTVATGSRPTLQLNSQNGHAGVLFDGSNDFLTSTIAGIQSLSSVSILMVLKTASAAAADASTGAFFGFGNVGSASGSFGLETGLALTTGTGALAGEFVAPLFKTGRLGSTTYRRAANTAQLIDSRFTSAGTSLFVNNSQASLDLSANMTTSTSSGPSSTGHTADNDLHFGALRASGAIAAYAPQMTVHEVVVYNRSITADERTSLWNAIQAKWGIA
jgi:hypothetical protein